MHGLVGRGARLGRDASTVQVYARPSARVGCIHGPAVRDARLGRDACAHGRVNDSVVTLGSDIRYARLGWSWCTAWSGRVHGLAATHGLVAYGLNFMGMIEPCG